MTFTKNPKSAIVFLSIALGLPSAYLAAADGQNPESKASESGKKSKKKKSHEVPGDPGRTVSEVPGDNSPGDNSKSIQVASADDQGSSYSKKKSKKKVKVVKEEAK